MLFQAFFQQVMDTDKAADALRIKGKPDLKARDHFKTQAKLNDGENAVLKQMAQTCSAEYQAVSKQGMETVQRLKATYPKRSDLPTYAVNLIDQLERERQAVMANCVARFQRQLGSTSFGKIDTFVRQKVAPSVRLTQPVSMGTR